MPRIIRTLLRRQNTIYGIANSAAQNNSHTFVASGNVVTVNIVATGLIATTGNIVSTGGYVEASYIKGYGTGFANMNVISAQPGQPTQTWTIPNGVQRFKVTLIGAGGQGGGAHPVANNIGYGGSSAGICIGFYDTVGGVSTVSMNVGQANGVGAGVVVNANGFNGFSSNINYNNTWMFANGGLGGANSWFGGITPNNVIAVGGSASGGSLNLSGYSGGTGGNTYAFSTSGALLHLGMSMGVGGDAPLGYGKSEVYFTSAAGTPGNNGAGYGTGGGAGRSGTSATARAGGTGANGVIIIEW